MAKIEKIKVFVDGNWVCYGKLDPAMKRREELARGSGMCPYVEGEDIVPDSDLEDRAESAEIAARARAAVEKAQAQPALVLVFNVKQSALKNILILFAEMHHVDLDTLLIRAGKFEKWLLRPAASQASRRG